MGKQCRHCRSQHGQQSFSTADLNYQASNIVTLQNGGYINPPRISRQHRDPYGDWWDKQERRNYGEPVHEDNDILGMFAPEEYNHYTSPQCFALMGCSVLGFLAVFGTVYMFYPDRVSVSRGYEGGLDRELGGPGALHVGLFRSYLLETLTYPRRGVKMELTEVNRSLVQMCVGRQLASIVHSIWRSQALEKFHKIIQDYPKFLELRKKGLHAVGYMALACSNLRLYYAHHQSTPVVQVHS